MLRRIMSYATRSRVASCALFLELENQKYDLCERDVWTDLNVHVLLICACA